MQSIHTTVLLILLLFLPSSGSSSLIGSGTNLVLNGNAQNDMSFWNNNLCQSVNRASRSCFAGPDYKVLVGNRNCDMNQTIDFTSTATVGDISLIDRGMVVATLSALLGGYQDHDDYATVYMTAYTSSCAQQLFSSWTLQPIVYAADRNEVTGFLSRQRSFLLPRRTRCVKVYFTSTLKPDTFSNGDCDGYATEIKLTLRVRTETASLPPTVSLMRLSLTGSATQSASFSGEYSNSDSLSGTTLSSYSHSRSLRATNSIPSST